MNCILPPEGKFTTCSGVMMQVNGIGNTLSPFCSLAQRKNIVCRHGGQDVLLLALWDKKSLRENVQQRC